MWYASCSGMLCQSGQRHMGPCKQVDVKASISWQHSIIECGTESPNMSAVCWAALEQQSPCDI
jgi:hypothetical protein